MLTCHFIILCSVFLSSESNAEFKCSKDLLISLIKCLMKNTQHAFVNPFAHIEAMEAVVRRFECAKEVDCTPQNNLILEPMEIWILREFVECMEKREESDHLMVKQEYECRFRLGGDLYIYASKYYFMYVSDSLKSIKLWYGMGYTFVFITNNCDQKVYKILVSCRNSA